MPVKKTGVKLHIGVDIAGLPHALLITPADVTDRDGAIEMMNYYYDVTDHLDVVLKVLADGGLYWSPYSGPPEVIRGKG